MDRFEHLAMMGFLILGLGLIRLVTNMTALVLKDNISKEYTLLPRVDPNLTEIEPNGRRKLSLYDTKDVEFYWVHSIFVFITLFTIILFWWTYYPLNDLEFWPNNKWTLWTYLLFLTVPILMFMLCEVLAPQHHKDIRVDMKRYWYRYHSVILGLAWLVQAALIFNLLLFFQEPWDSIKLIGRYIMLVVMLPMIFFQNHKLHEILMSIFFIGFLYIIVKYHIYS